ncbi:hypothetical protein CLM76_09210 [Vreelandella venusta]|nr:hypothetical protein CLM76_09210 [Halomonas hydrothermalis]
MSAIYVNDPANGESVSLSELARRHGLTAGCLSRRYHQGLRGWSLVEQIDREALARAKAAEYREKLERQQQLAAANTAALMRPLNHIAEVSKMVGGAS